MPVYNTDPLTDEVELTQDLADTSVVVSVPTTFQCIEGVAVISTDSTVTANSGTVLQSNAGLDIVPSSGDITVNLRAKTGASTIITSTATGN